MIRKHAIAGVLSLLLLAGCEDREAPMALSTSEQAGASSEVVIAAVGDSLTEGLGLSTESAYPAVLERKLNRDGYDVKVINAGVSGETSSGTLSRIDWILTLSPDIVILETGANDGLRGLPVEDMKRNIDRIVSKLRSEGVVVVLAGMKMYRNMGADYVAAFEKAYTDIAEKYNLIRIPFFLEGVAGVWSLNRRDAMHPNAQGYEKVVETIYPYVVEALKKADGGE